MKILITAFEPFGGQIVNPALEAMKLLPRNINGIEIIKREIPTVFQKSIEIAWQVIDREKPDFVISLGQAGGRSCISVERVAINIDDSLIADNEGNVVKDRFIFPDGENAYFSSLNIKNIVKAIRECGIPAEVSNSAGTFVCNHLMYGVLYKIHKQKLNTRAGFIHVPFIPEQVTDRPNKASMSLDNIVKAIETACKTLKYY